MTKIFLLLTSFSSNVNLYHLPTCQTSRVYIYAVKLLARVTSSEGDEEPVFPYDSVEVFEGLSVAQVSHRPGKVYSPQTRLRLHQLDTVFVLGRRIEDEKEEA